MLEEAYIIPKDPAVVVRWEQGRNSVREYIVLRATLFNGEKFVVDFTHSQWGWNEVLLDWSKFVELRARSVRAIAPIGYWTGVTCKIRNLEPEPQSYDFNVVMLRKGAMAALVECLKDFVQGQAEGLVGFIDQPQHLFTDSCIEIVENLKETISAKLKSEKARGYGRVYFEEPENWWTRRFPPGHEDDIWKKASWKHNVVTTGGQLERAKRGWMTRDEVVECDGDIDSLKRLWALRMQERVPGPEFFSATSVVSGSRNF